MKRISIVLVVLTMMLTLGGCSSDGVVFDSPPQNAPAPEAPAPIPGGDSVEISGGDTFIAAPAYLELNNLYPSAEVSTWTQDGYYNLDGYELEYKKGDPVGVALYNGRAYAVSYEVTVVNAPLPLNPCKTTGGEYHQAPEGFQQWVTLGDASLTLGAKEIWVVPFCLYLPQGVEYPESWEFRLVFTEQVEGGQFARSYPVRILITME